MKDAVKIAVIGNPNCGKTTLFNSLTGSSQRVGNWPGVTVEKKEGSFSIDGSHVILVDLPGIYSLTAESEDERIARDYLLSRNAGLILNIVDATNLERNLSLTVQLIEMGLPMVVVLNMADLAKKMGLEVDLAILEGTLGCPVVAISATDEGDMPKVKRLLANAALRPPTGSVKVNYPRAIVDVTDDWAKRLSEYATKSHINPKWLALKLIERDTWAVSEAVSGGIIPVAEIDSTVSRLEQTLGENIDGTICNARFSQIGQILKKVIKTSGKRETMSERIDRLVLNRILGIPIFVCVMYLIFWITIAIGGSFIDFFDILFGTLFVDGFGVLLASLHAPEWLIAILAGGIGTGIQTLATFIPIMLMMFLMLSLLEDSGYMARAAFVMDRLLSWMGLPGKAFVPMLVGFGCSVPAIMAARTMENRRDRLLTVMMVPFMSCGARLPVYALFGAAFFGASSMNVVFSLYMVGILFAILTGLLMRKTLLKGESSYFVMELPAYHAPRMRNILTYTWNRLSVFMLRTKTVVVAVAILSILNAIGTDGSIGHEDSRDSLLSSIGRGIAPVFAPMGVSEENWPAVVGVFTGIFAKEAVVGTLNSLYSQNEYGLDTAEEVSSDEGFDFMTGVKEAFSSVPDALSGVLGGLSDPMGLGIIGSDEAGVAEEVGADERIFSALQSNFKGKAAAYAYLLFILIYFPCVGALGVLIREIGKWYGALSVIYLTVLAWVISTLFYQVAQGHQVVWIVVATLIAIGIVAILSWLGGRQRGDEHIVGSINAFKA